MENQFERGGKAGASEEYQTNPEAKPTDHSRHQPNKGEIYFPEKHPLDPQADHDAEVISHKGGLASQRTELY
jgi:hypothetical protein